MAAVDKSQRPLVYLATPYSHDDALVMSKRFGEVNKAAAKLMRAGIHVFSPISHNHPIAMDHELPTGWDFWEAYDMAYLKCSHRLIVLKLEGWEQSVGVAAEIKMARELGLEIEYMEPE